MGRILYRTNDIYECLQGEGALAGTPMALVRLHGCGVGCPWCDTKETWKAEPAHRVDSLDACLGTGPDWCEADPFDIAGKARELAPAAMWALVTGGEPAEQELSWLAAALKGEGFRTAVETSGTAPGLGDRKLWDWITLSPKLGMPGGKAVLPDVIEAAHEIKMVVGRPADLAAYDAMLAETPGRLDAVLSLQPVAHSGKALDLCVEACKARGWRLSVQLHKIIGER